MLKPCMVCGTPSNGPRCPAHTIERTHHDTTTARGYGSAHQRARSQIARTLPDYCGYGCGTFIHAGDDWVAAHVVDGDPNEGYLLACRSCNERAKRTAGAGQKFSRRRR